MAQPADVNINQAPSQTPSGLPYPGVAGLPVFQAQASGGPVGRPTGVDGEYIYNSVGVKGALTINPAYASDFYAGNFLAEYPVPGDNTPSKGVPSAGRPGVRPDAQTGAPDAWKLRAPPPLSTPIIGTTAASQTVMKWPWNKKFIPPLALFNDASQWVNTLLLNQAMTWFGAATSLAPLMAQYFTPRPINTNNLAAGTLNEQLQLGQLKIQAQQLTLTASNYYGGS